MRIKKISGITCFLLLTSAAKWAVADFPAVVSPENRTLLDGIRQRAEQQAGSNLNRFGLEALKQYDSRLDSLSVSELRDSLALLETQFEKESTDRHRILDSFQAQVDSLRLVKASVSSSNEKLLRKSGIAFLIWLLVVMLVLQFRRRLLGKAGLRLAASKAQEEATRSSVSEGELIIQDTALVLPKYETAMSAIGSLQSELAAAGQDPASPWSSVSGFSDISRSAGTLATLLKKNQQVKAAIHLLGKTDDDIKEKLDINQLCDVAMEICSLGYATQIEHAGIQLKRDLEKQLPPVEANRRMIIGLLLDVLDNAFQAVVQKHQQSIKGYQPGVTISTRVLPRFVQIRIKDNGVGISSEFQKSLFEEFNTTRALGFGAGLGLAESKRILDTHHKGEIKVESDPGNGTDVYIKFFNS